ncbi:MAG TPA: DeoR/GlpR family DNA-binding transcription regulator [bacterium]|nr:DeoR/GlpR family DNA-binding transcription regulator [bacterium]HNS48121.1 DeoR/GlpR family DNA-binding transcription regulator [bacterium]
MGIGQLRRTDLIRRALEEENLVSVAALVRRTGASTATIRRDLERLEKTGFLVRTYGGAVRQDIPDEFLFPRKAERNRAAKAAIARRALALLKEGDTIFLDSGTTAREMARLIGRTDRTFTVVTNSLPAAGELQRNQSLKIFLLGGFLRRELLDFFSPAVLAELEKFHLNKAFLGIDGLTAADGLTTTDVDSARIEETAMRISQVVVVLADRSKIGRTTLIPYGTLKKIDCLITDRGADPRELSRLRRAGLKIILTEGK